MPEPVLLSSLDMAHFVARGFLRLDALVPAALNRQFLAEAGQVNRNPGDSLTTTYQQFMASSGVPEVRPGTRLDAAYAPGSALQGLLQLPRVAGAIHSLVGPDPVFDHHFLHLTFPPAWYRGNTRPPASQHLHQDSTIDPRQASFDLQLMYFPHAVDADMGGTRFVPGTHLRLVSEAAVGRYQNMRGQQHMVCPAGTILLLHHGIWHGGGMNRSATPRIMFKIRMNPSQAQVRLWDLSDLPADHLAQRPIFWTRSPPRPDDIHAVLTTPEPWFEADTGRLEYLNRIRLWRHLLGIPDLDIDWWLSRVENQHN